MSARQLLPVKWHDLTDPLLYRQLLPVKQHDSNDHMRCRQLLPKHWFNFNSCVSNWQLLYDRHDRPHSLPCRFFSADCRRILPRRMPSLLIRKLLSRGLYSKHTLPVRLLLPTLQRHSAIRLPPVPPRLLLVVGRVGVFPVCRRYNVVCWRRCLQPLCALRL